MVFVVLRFSCPDRLKPFPPKEAHRRHAPRSARALLLGVLVSVLPTVLAAPPVLAQTNNWGGDVLVSDSSISVAPGESVTYSVRLNRKPTETDGTALDNKTVGWFVMVHINGLRYQDGEYKDLTLIPSFYRPFTGKHDPNYPNDDGDWDEWKDFRIYRASYNDWEGRGKQTSERATSVTLTHEVWDHNANCPVHRRSPVTVGIGGSTPPPDNNGGTTGDTNDGKRRAMTATTATTATTRMAEARAMAATTATTATTRMAEARAMAATTATTATTRMAEARAMAATTATTATTRMAEARVMAATTATTRMAEARVMAVTVLP